MTTTRLHPICVRLSADLRALVDQAGPLNAATRALLILGAVQAGYAVDDLANEIVRVLAADLDEPVRLALQHVYGDITRDITGDVTRTEPEGGTGWLSSETTPLLKTLDDPFGGVGIAV